MTTYDMGAAAGCICGLLMVIGGMILLYTGAVSLNKTSKEEAASLEFNRLFRLTTHYPALGLFVIGLAFIVTSVFLSRPPDNRVMMNGALAMPPGVTFDQLDPHYLTLSLESTLQPSFDPNTNAITVVGDPTTTWQLVITYPGMYAQKPIDAAGRREIPLGKITLARVAEKPAVNLDNIAPLPQEFAAHAGGL
jgi:hypothetical protein